MFKLNCVILSLFNTLVSFAEKGQIMMIFVMNNISYIYIIHIFYLSHIYCQRYNSLTLRLVARQVPNCKQVGFVRLFFFSIADNDCSDDEKLNKIQCSRLTFHKVRNILTHWIRYLEMLIFDRGKPIFFNGFFPGARPEAKSELPTPGQRGASRQMKNCEARLICLFVCLRRDFQN